MTKLAHSKGTSVRLAQRAKRTSRNLNIFGSCILLALTTLAPLGSAHAKGFSVVHSFTGGSDGATPVAGLLLKKSTLHGTAYAAGVNNLGNVFKLEK